MQGVLTGNEIKTLGLKGEYCPIRLHQQVLSGALGWACRSMPERRVEPYQVGVGQHGAIRH